MTWRQLRLKLYPYLVVLGVLLAGGAVIYLFVASMCGWDWATDLNRSC
jgi:hypothetical protein